MKLTKQGQNLAYDKIEIEDNKILLFLQRFWQFSKFYGEYLASLHSQKKLNSRSRSTYNK